ncbi:MAG TPA: hypothetical protein VM124_00735 [Candidatus Limnocylindrales bacterium]|nr:hypothetical protein [Candidatus Limnocylindrales bacterium]
MHAPAPIECPLSAGLVLPELRPDVHFDVISSHVEVVLTGYGAGYDIIDPTVRRLEDFWHPEKPEDADANRLVVVQAVAAGPDTQANRQAISRVTGVYIDPVPVTVADLLQDIAKPSELSRHSQSGRLWTPSHREAMRDHPDKAMRIILASNFPDYFRGRPFKKPVAVAVGHHHSNQPWPSIEYGCDEALDLLSAPIRDSIAPSDWFGAKFYRANSGNCDEFGRPLSDQVRSLQFWNYLGYFFRKYWYVNERNNAGQVRCASYETFEANHPSRLSDLDTVIRLEQESRETFERAA